MHLDGRLVLRRRPSVLVIKVKEGT